MSDGTLRPWSPRVKLYELYTTFRAISANESVVSARYGPFKRSTMRPSRKPMSAVARIAAGMPMASGAFRW